MTRLEWPSSLPMHWSAKPLRALVDHCVSNVDKIPANGELPVRLCNYSEVYKNEFITLALDFMPGTASEEERRKFGLQAGDVVITKDSESWEDIGVPAFVKESAEDVVCGYHLAILRPKDQRISGRFLFRCLQAKSVRVQLELAASDGVTRFGIPKSEIGGVWVPLPPAELQSAIADYLDRETAQLDALIAAKERLLDLLTEKRYALVTRAVTRGLDPNCPLRDPDIPWLGLLPERWATRRIAWLFSERDERGAADLPLLEVSIHAGVVRREFSDDKIESTAADFNTYKVARRGDVVFNKMRMWQGAVGVAPEDGLVSPDYVVAEPNGMMSPEFAKLLFRTPVFSAECGRRSHGIVWDRLRLYWEEFRDIRVPLPSPGEQAAVVESVARETKKLAELAGETKRTISLLKERRSALIAAAVTGQIPVAREAVR